MDSCWKTADDESVVVSSTLTRGSLKILIDDGFPLRSHSRRQ
jgi:hypothetical protein